MNLGISGLYCWLQVWFGLRPEEDRPFSGRRSFFQRLLFGRVVSAGRATLAVLGLTVSACSPTTTVWESKVLPEPRPPLAEAGLPPAYPRSRIIDARLRAVADEFAAWARGQATAEANPAPLYSKVEVLPVTQTVLPYGVGAYQKEPRLTAILTTGSGWAHQTAEQKEIAAAQAFRKLSLELDALKIDPPTHPTVTIQAQSGLVLGWITDLVEGRKNIHGDDQ
jgi:hypothetical protein